MIRAELEPLREIDRWFSALRWVWDIRLEALDKLLTKRRTTPMTELSLSVTRTIKAPAEGDL